jgi:dephospho-CoA kinase
VLNLRKIAITGGVSTGKSTVCRLLADRGAYVVDTDKIVHTLLSSDSQIRKQVINLLGAGVLVDGQINRKAIADKVFSDPETLKSLELLLHPAVFHEMQLQYQRVKDDPKYNLFVAEVPLLYETESSKLFDCVVVVLSERQLCLNRFTKENKGSLKSFEQRMQRQMEPKEKAAKANLVLINNDSIENLSNQVTKLLTKIRSI